MRTLLTYPLEHPEARQVSLHQWDAISACQTTWKGRGTQLYPGSGKEKTCSKIQNNEYNVNKINN